VPDEEDTEMDPFEALKHVTFFKESKDKMGFGKISTFAEVSKEQDNPGNVSTTVYIPASKSVGFTTVCVDPEPVIRPGPVQL